MKCGLILAMTSFAFAHAGTDCPRPHLDNGIVSGSSNANMFVGTFSCNPGYHLVGNSVVKCRQGTWTNRIPVCIKIGTCPQLPEIPNGIKIRVAGTRGSMFRTKCQAGFIRLGARRLYCAGTRWSAEMPVCAKANCELNGMENIDGGYAVKSMGGAMYRYSCMEGAEMTGSSVVYCDGSSWNATSPTCLGAPGPVKVQTWVNGEKTSSVKVGDFVTVTCTSGGGFPAPRITIFKNFSLVADSDTMSKPYFTFAATAKDNNADIACFSENKAVDQPQEDHIRLSVTYIPEEIVLSGPSSMSVDEEARLSCTTSPSHPEPAILWKIIKVRGEKEEEEQIVESDAVTKEVKDEGVSVKAVLKLTHIEMDVDRVMVKCVARMEGVEDIQSGIKTVDITGPPGLPEMTGIQSGSSLPEGSLHILTCKALAGKPSASVVWLKDGAAVQGVEWHSHGKEVVSQWRYRAEMGDEEIGCMVFNAVSKEHAVTTVKVEVVQAEIEEPTEKVDTVDEVESAATELEENDEGTSRKKDTTGEKDIMIESGDHIEQNKGEEENYEPSEQENTNEVKVSQTNVEFEEQSTEKIMWIETPNEVTEGYSKIYRKPHKENDDENEDGDEEDEDYDEPMRAQQEVPVKVVNQKASQSSNVEFKPRTSKLSNNSPQMYNHSVSLILFSSILAFIIQRSS